MSIIDELLLTIPDKFQHHTTTSHQFKRDIFEFFNKDEFKNKICVEWGSNIGYTTRVLSHLFKEVTGFNKERVVEAIEFNKDRPNIHYYAQDIYTTDLPIDTGDVFFVDAVHTYDAVIDDTMRSLGFKSSGKKYFVYDDYGAFPEIKQAINDLVSCEKIKIVKMIGHSDKDKFIRELYDYEGLICEEYEQELYNNDCNRG